MFLIVSPLAHMITTSGRKLKTQIRSSSRTSGNSLLSMNAARDSDPSCPPSIATNLTTQMANKADFPNSWQKTGTKHSKASSSLVSSQNTEIKPVCDLAFSTPATCDKFKLQISLAAYIRRVDGNHKPLLLLLSGHKTIWRWRSKMIEWHCHFNFHTIEQFGASLQLMESSISAAV